MGSLSKVFTFITYIILLPSIVYACHRAVKKRRKAGNVMTKCSEDVRILCNNFYTMWLFSAIFNLMAIYYIFVLGELKINCFENLAFVSLFVCTFGFFYVTVKINEHCIMKNKKEGLDESYSILNSDVSSQSLKMAQDVHYCKFCDAYILEKDHHCLW